MRITTLLFLSLAFPASLAAQDGVRTTDTLLSQSELSEQLTGHMVEFFDGSKSRYGSDGRYGYTYTDDGPAWEGQFSVDGDGRVCVDFDNGSRRCDQFVQANGRLVLVTNDGLRFPVRHRSVYQR